MRVTLRAVRPPTPFRRSGGAPSPPPDGPSGHARFCCEWAVHAGRRILSGTRPGRVQVATLLHEAHRNASADNEDGDETVAVDIGPGHKFADVKLTRSLAADITKCDGHERHGAGARTRRQWTACAARCRRHAPLLTHRPPGRSPSRTSGTVRGYTSCWGRTRRPRRWRRAPLVRASTWTTFSGSSTRWSHRLPTRPSSSEACFQTSRVTRPTCRYMPSPDRHL